MIGPQESDIYTSLEEMGQSEVEENHSKTTVKHCISKFNSNSTPTEGKIWREKIFNLEMPTPLIAIMISRR